MRLWWRGMVMCIGALIGGMLPGACAAEAVPALRLSPLFTEHMVLQREQPIPVWGWAAPGEMVTVDLAGSTATAVAGADGYWIARLPARPASTQPLVMRVGTREAQLPEITDILVGDVWVCAGQSNMDFSLRNAEGGAQEIAIADRPLIRYFTAAQVVADTPAPVMKVRNAWTACTPQTAAGMYAVAYFFAVAQQRVRGDVPIGLIQAAWSGTPAEAFCPREVLENDPALKPILRRAFADRAAYEAAKRAYDAKVPAWMAARRPTDTGNAGEAAGWALPAVDLVSWGTVSLPMMFMHGEPALFQYGACWVRRTVEIPAAWAGHPLALGLGGIADFDVTYFDGQRIGATETDAAQTATVARQYTVPAALVSAGTHTIAVRMFTRYGEPGFSGKPEAMRLTRADAPDEAAIPLAGDWRYRVERGCPIAPLPREPKPFDGNCAPAKVFNGMIAPLIPVAMRGVLWYQGEHNADHAAQYQLLFPALIRGWLARWQQGDFPFLYVQLPNWLMRQEAPGESSWAEQRDVQRRLLALPNTGMAITIDLGDKRNIHPTRKREVGERLALVAEKVVFKRDIAYSGPLYRAMQVEGNRIRLDFDCTFAGLKSADGGALTGFTIAGADRRFAPAQATIDGTHIWVSSADVPHPVAVRYAWQYNPACNLINGANLPASPFRTDDWPFLLSLEETEADYGVR